MDTALELAKRAGHFAQLTGGPVGTADLAQQRGSAAELADLSGIGGGNRCTAHHIDSPLLGATRRAAVGGRPATLTVSMSGAARRSGYAAVLSAYESSRDLGELRSAKLMSAGQGCTGSTAI